MKVLFDGNVFEREFSGERSRMIADLMDKVSIKFEVKADIMETLNSSLLRRSVPQYGVHLRQFLHSITYKQKRLVFRLWYSILFKKFAKWDKTAVQNKNYGVVLRKQGDYDVYHVTSSSTFFLKQWKNKPYTLSIYDMVEEVKKQIQMWDYSLFRNTELSDKQSLAEGAAAIFVPTEYTKQAVHEFFHIEDSKIIVIPPTPMKMGRSLGEPLIHAPYVLCVMNEYNEDKISALIHSWKVICANEINLKLVVLYYDTITKPLVYSRDHDNQILYYKPRSDAEYCDLIKNAELLIVPDIYENVYLPVVDAFANHQKVLVNSKNVYVKEWGKAVFTFDMQIQMHLLGEKISEIRNMKDAEQEIYYTEQDEYIKKYNKTQASERIQSVYNSIICGRNETNNSHSANETN